MTIRDLKTEFQAMTCLPLFEVEVECILSGEKEWLDFNISIIRNSLVAQHEALTLKEARSKFIANKRLALDACFSLDKHLQELHEDCLEAIANSDLFRLV